MCDTAGTLVMAAEQLKTAGATKVMRPKPAIAFEHVSIPLPCPASSHNLPPALRALSDTPSPSPPAVPGVSEPPQLPPAPSHPPRSSSSPRIFQPSFSHRSPSIQLIIVPLVQVHAAVIHGVFSPPGLERWPPRPPPLLPTVCCSSCTPKSSGGSLVLNPLITLQSDSSFVLLHQLAPHSRHCLKCLFT